MASEDSPSVVKSVFTLIFVLVMIFRGFFVDDRTGIHAAENFGFTEVQLVDAKHVFVGLRGCDAHDAAGFLLHAKNAAEGNAELIVCCGWPFKGCTARTP
jgi:hypothetical protein